VVQGSPRCFRVPPSCLRVLEGEDGCSNQQTGREHYLNTQNKSVDDTNERNVSGPVYVKFRIVKE
jgi:hypothetical protein